MNGKEAAIRYILENIDEVLKIITEQEESEEEFGFIRELTDQLREEVIVLQS